MINKKCIVRILFVLLTVILAACGGKNSDMNDSEGMKKDDSGAHEDMNHSSTGEVPKGLAKAENPEYEVGEKVIITAGHMKGMKGAEATIVGAYDTTVYAVSYKPTNGGERVENHKWVIHEEIADPGKQPLNPGTEVTIKADHMKGMKGATATIDSAKQTTVYMIDYIPTTGGEKVTNHKWVTGSELKPE